MQNPLAQAAQSTKVVLVDTTTDNPSYATSAIASDNEGGGRAAFEALQKLNPAGGKVMVMSTDPGVSTVDARIKGFEDAAKADSKFTYLNVQYSHNDPATAANLMGSALQKDPDLVGVFAANLFSAEGTATGVRQANKGDQVKVVSFDAGPNQVKDLRANTIQALVAHEPALMPDAAAFRPRRSGGGRCWSDPAVIVRNPSGTGPGRCVLSDVSQAATPPLRSSMTGGPARSLRLLVEPHQLVHQLIDAVAGLRGELLDGRILHRGDIGAEFVRAPRHRPGLAEQCRDHLRRRRIRLVHVVLGHDDDCAALHK
jgi:hypothetical protein